MRTSHHEFLRILANGTCIVRKTDDPESNEVIRGQIAQEELQALLHFVLRERKLMAWDAGAVKRGFAKRARDGKPVDRIEDASTIVIRVSIATAKKTARLHGLGYVSKSVPELPMVQDLRAVQNNLHHVAALLRAGGEEGLKPCLVAINKALKKDWPQ